MGGGGLSETWTEITLYQADNHCILLPSRLTSIHTNIQGQMHSLQNSHNTWSLRKLCQCSTILVCIMLRSSSDFSTALQREQRNEGERAVERRANIRTASSRTCTGPETTLETVNSNWGSTNWRGKQKLTQNSILCTEHTPAWSKFTKLVFSGEKKTLSRSLDNNQVRTRYYTIQYPAYQRKIQRILQKQHGQFLAEVNT